MRRLRTRERGQPEPAHAHARASDPNRASSSSAGDTDPGRGVRSLSTWRLEHGADRLSEADPESPLTGLTNLMNSITAMQTWGHEEYFKDMSRQLNADIIKQLLQFINARRAPIRVVKIKSYRGVQLNEAADQAAGAAAAADPIEADTYFDCTSQDSTFTFSWT